MLGLGALVFVLGLQVLDVVHGDEHLPILFELPFGRYEFGTKLSKFEKIEPVLFLIVAFVDAKGD